MTSFSAFTVGRIEDVWSRSVTEMTTDQLGEGGVLIRVDYSGINYKDGLASTESGRIARISPLIPGIDLAGVVVESDDDSVAVGAHVLAHGYDIGVAHHGGFAGYARVPAEWVVHMPGTLTSKQAMMIGTAGFTAAKSVAALEDAGLRPDSGPVLVTGATGGVGSVAVGILARMGFEVVASSGKAGSADWLRSLGATAVIGRDETSAASKRPMETERWAGAVDCVGGSTLAYVLRTLRYGASVAASGLTGGGDLPTSVFPFILRGANLLGIDSVQTPIETRRALWSRIATDLRPPQIDADSAANTEVVGLAALPGALDRILAGDMIGRVLVDPHLAP
jgi:acrylyl-CoA reductase (NADPH)